MRAMLLSAGLGERMQPLTLTTPKPLLKIKGESLIVRHICALVQSGIEEIIINLGYRGSQIEETLGNGSQWGAQLRYSYEDPILNTGGGIVQALPLLGPDPFVVVSSDLYTDFPFNRLPTHPKGLIHLVMVDNPPHHPKGDFALVDGVLQETGGPLLNFGGIGVYYPELFEDSKPEPFPLSRLFRKAIRSGFATGEHYKGVWHNVGTPEQLQALELS